MLDLDLHRVDIVVLAESTNPPLLNPDFLERNAIVPTGWKVKNVIVTPPLALVDYDNGYLIQVEEGKIQFACSKPTVTDWRVELPRTAKTYMAILPHVAYRAVGFNFVIHAREPVGQIAEDQLVSKLLKPGPWVEHAGGLSGAIVEFQFRRAQPYISLRTGVRAVTTPAGRRIESYLFTGNCHHDFTPQDVNGRNAFLGTLPGKYDEVMQLITSLGLEKSWKQ